MENKQKTTTSKNFFDQKNTSRISLNTQTQIKQTLTIGRQTDTVAVLNVDQEFSSNVCNNEKKNFRKNSFEKKKGLHQRKKANKQQQLLLFGVAHNEYLAR